MRAAGGRHPHQYIQGEQESRKNINDKTTESMSSNQEEQIQPDCTCGQHISSLDDLVKRDGSNQRLDASFVHLSSHPHQSAVAAWSPNNNAHDDGLLLTFRHEETLLQVAEGTSRSLCRDCLDR
jgi:hypothetical protein